MKVQVWELWAEKNEKKLNETDKDNNKKEKDNEEKIIIIVDPHGNSDL